MNHDMIIMMMMYYLNSTAINFIIKFIWHIICYKPYNYYIFNIIIIIYIQYNIDIIYIIIMDYG